MFPSFIYSEYAFLQHYLYSWPFLLTLSFSWTLQIINFPSFPLYSRAILKCLLPRPRWPPSKVYFPRPRASTVLTHTRSYRQKRRQSSSLLLGGQNSFNTMPNYRFSTRMIWRKGWVEERTLGRMDASEKWMIIWFTPHQNHHLPKWMFFQKIASYHPCC